MKKTLIALAVAAILAAGGYALKSQPTQIMAHGNPPFCPPCK